VAAALNTYIAVQRLHPDIIINAGTVGGFRRKSAEIGDVFISTQIKHHDRRIPIPGFVEYGKGHYHAIPTPNLINVKILHPDIT
jgi:5'-methylthioadenosine nucleosidase